MQEILKNNYKFFDNMKGMTKNLIFLIIKIAVIKNN